MARKSTAKTEKEEEKKKSALVEWTERDLSIAARNGELLPAFEAETELQQVYEILASGQNPILVGDSGVGKTTLIHELARRSITSTPPPGMDGLQILQLSLRHRASSLANPNEIRPELQKLFESLNELTQPVVPYFRDIHLIYQYDLESILETMGFRLNIPILGEGEKDATLRMFEYNPELHHYFVMVSIDEPSFDRAARIVKAWTGEQCRRNGKQFESGAIEEAMHLSHRFLARGRLPRIAIELLSQVASLTEPGGTITEQAIVDRFCNSNRVPENLINPEIPMDLLELEDRFGEQLLGQQEAVHGVVQMIGLIKSGLSDARRPFGVFLFVGPTGVGKTHLAQLLAEYLFGGRDRMVRFNMADFGKELDAEVLFGDPNQHGLAQRRGVFTQRVSGYPFAVLLLDEFEKAHERVHDRFLQLFDEGSFINGAGEVVSCRSMIVIATSNAGAEVYRNQAVGFATQADPATVLRDVDRRIGETFRFEFLNRFDQVVHFHPLNREHIRTIAERELEQLKMRAGLKRRQATLEVDESVLDWLTAHGYDPFFGARFLRRTLERNVTTALAAILAGFGREKKQVIQLSVQRNRVVALLRKNEPLEQRSRQSVTLPVGTKEQVRTLDRPQLLEALRALLETAGPRLSRLHALRDEASKLLERMAEEDIWSRQAESRELLDRYRDLDVAIQADGRHAAPLEMLAKHLENNEVERFSLEVLARKLEAGAAALRHWEERLAYEGASAVWLLISRVDPLHTDSEWLSELANLELAWCRSLGMHASVVACELVEGQLTRLALEVEGPGAEANLGMEVGQHRRHRSQRMDARARVDVVPQTDTPEIADAIEVSATRRRKGHHGLTLSWRARIELVQRGMNVELLGEDKQGLLHLLSDLEPLLRDQPESEVARMYGMDGAGARDPRTGVNNPRLKDVLKGDLNRFLEGWRAHMRAEGTERVR